jgi:hypothetical protein
MERPCKPPPEPAPGVALTAPARAHAISAMNSAVPIAAAATIASIVLPMLSFSRYRPLTFNEFAANCKPLTRSEQKTRRARL